jgi:hypothetical protein
MLYVSIFKLTKETRRRVWGARVQHSSLGCNEAQYGAASGPEGKNFVSGVGRVNEPKKTGPKPTSSKFAATTQSDAPQNASAGCDGI